MTNKRICCIQAALKYLTSLKNKVKAASNHYTRVQGVPKSRVFTQYLDMTGTNRIDLQRFVSDRQFENAKHSLIIFGKYEENLFHF